MKVLTCSRYFPKGHPKAGQPTYFAEKIMACLADKIPGWEMKNDFVMYDWYAYYNCTLLKHHTIRAGSRFKVGDTISLRVWSDKPYRSKQVEFAQVEVKKTWEIRMTVVGNEIVWQLPGIGSGPLSNSCRGLNIISHNDGLECQDFIDWFSIHPKRKEQTFAGQIICWTDKVEY